MALVNTLQPVPTGNNTFNNAMHSHPQITSETLLRAIANHKQSLFRIQDLLNHLFVRNRNQHRRNHWFKSLQQFRKQIGLLIEEIEGEEKKKGSRKEQLDVRLRFWDERCIHQWYLHFTQLVAVGPFAVLGLVLMACTARVCKITGITDLYEEIGSEDMRMTLQMIDDGAVEEELGSLLSGGEVDEGVVIAREE